MNEQSTGSARDRGLSLADLDYDLPAELIAQHPLPCREDSRLLILDRAGGKLHDSRIASLPDLLDRGDLLVLNNTKVLPAKFMARRQSGGKVRGLFIREDGPGIWRVMLEASGRIGPGETLEVTSGESIGLTIDLLQSYGAGEWRVAVAAKGTTEEILSRIGSTPLPPYIHRDETDLAIELEDRVRYQTVYAQRPGAIAAPTAGLHLTPALVDAIRTQGVDVAYLTLHVGVGTFRPIQAVDLAQHVMHAEWYELGAEAATRVRMCSAGGGRVVAVGTTTVRALEASAEQNTDARTVGVSSGTTSLFIQPPYRFHVVDALLTNFHLPKSTLIALVMAFAGVENIRRAYRHAIEQRYRFYSYGDAMLIL